MVKLTAVPEYPQDASRHLAEFLTRHALHSADQIAAQRKAITWTREIHGVITEAYGQFTRAELQGFPASGIILQLLHRAADYLETAIVALTSRSEGSSDVLSRVSVELSNSIEFILQGQPESRLLAYVANDLRTHEQQLAEWEGALESVSEDFKTLQLQQIARRRKAVGAMSSLIGRLHEAFRKAGVPVRPEPWPPAAARLSNSEAVSDPLYDARISGNIHSDAQEALREVIAGLSGDTTLMQRSAPVRPLFGRLMVYCAVRAFIDASARYARHYGIRKAEWIAKQGRVIIEREVEAVVDELEKT